MNGAMDPQSIIVALCVTGAVLYVVRALWPKQRSGAGCDSCSRNPGRADDYT